MSEDQKKLLKQQLWNLANTLSGKMNAEECRDYILDFIFYLLLNFNLNKLVFASGQPLVIAVK
jgi:type I restriction enzyme M protein